MVTKNNLKTHLMGAICAVSLIATSAIVSAEEKMYIPVISKGFQHQFWQPVKAGADQAAKEFNVDVTFEGPDSETMADRQIDMLAAALAKNPKDTGFAALDSQAATPLLKQAQKAGIPIIAFDSGVDSDISASTESTDNVAAAVLAANKIAELIGGKGKVTVVAHDQTSRTGIDRRDGFLNRIKAQHPGVEVVTVQYGAGDHLQSTELTKTILIANPDLKGIFGTSEGSAIGVSEMNRKDFVIIGYDSGQAQKKAIRSGLMAAKG